MTIVFSLSKADQSSEMVINGKPRGPMVTEYGAFIQTKCITPHLDLNVTPIRWNQHSSTMVPGRKKTSFIFILQIYMATHIVVPFGMSRHCPIL